VLIANERKDRLALVAPIVVALGHEVIAREVDVNGVGSVTARARPDVALVGLGESSEHALGLIEKVVREAACPVIVLLHSRDPKLVKEASDRGVFPHISDSCPGVAELDRHRATPLRRISRPPRRSGGALTERDTGILMERRSFADRNAFEMLHEQSRSANRTLIHLAAAVVDGYRPLPKHP
jgi:AmiR/NasT family two-component response regulator